MKKFFLVLTLSLVSFLGNNFGASASNSFDVNNDNKTGIIEAIYSLQVAAGMKTQTQTRSEIVWSTKSSMPTPRNALGIAVVANKIYAISGRGDDNSKFALEIYDPQTDSWVTKPNISESLFSEDFSSAIRNSGVGVVGSKIYVFSRYTSDFLIYDTISENWIKKGSPIIPRTGYYFSLSVVNEKIYIFGGLDSNNNYIDEVQVYDTIHDSWQKLNNSFPHPSDTSVSASFDDKIYVFGGYVVNFENETEKFNTNVDVLNTKTGEWSSITPMPCDVGDGGAVVINNKIYVTGIHPSRNNVTVIYDIKSDIWFLSNSYNAPIWQNDDIGVATVNGNIYLIGGNDINDNSQSLVQEGKIISGIAKNDNTKISDHLHSVCIEKGIDYESSDNSADDEYEFLIELVTDTNVQSVSVSCPGGKYIEITDNEHDDDGLFWKYKYDHIQADDLVQYGDGNYEIKLHYFNGKNESTTINYYDTDLSRNLPLITSIPKLTSHDYDSMLPPNQPVTFTWDGSSIDENAQLISLTCESEDTEHDKIYEVTDNVTSETFTLSNGTWECYFAQGIVLEGTNSDNINFELITYSETDYQMIVSESKNIPEATINIDDSTDDWHNIDSMLSDPSGDVDLYDGIDITNIYLAKDNNSMFLKLDRAGTSLPTGEYKSYWLYFMPVKMGGKAYAIHLFFEESNYPRINLQDISNNPDDYNQYIVLLDNLNYSIDMERIEISWPIRYFSESSSYYLKFFTHYTDNKIWNDKGDVNDNTIVINP